MLPLLHQAVFSNNVPLVHELLSRGADINQKEPQFGESPLNYLLNNESLSTSEMLNMAKILTNAGADVNSTNFIRSEPALNKAAYTRNLPMIEHLVSCGADVNLRNDTQTPLCTTLPVKTIWLPWLVRKILWRASFAVPKYF